MRTIQGNVVQEALDRHRRTGENLGKCLMAQGWPDEVSALQELASSLGIRFIDLSEETIDRTAAGEIPSELINKARVIPVALEGDRLVLAMANPFDFQTVEHIEILTGKQVERAICSESDMAAAMQTFYGHSVERMIKHLEKPGHEDAADNTQVGHLREIASEPTVVNLVNLIVVRAIRDRASDIHIEPFDSVVKVKYRIDGILHEMPAPPKHLQDAIISRVKIMADMNIAERFVPQDGHIELNFEGREVDVRVATVPTIYGECVVMRLLDKTSFLMGMETLGFDEDLLRRFQRLLEYPHGIVLVCGPTGSGKTSTLYAALATIFTPERKFITIEDPVEYELEGVNQIPVRPKRGLTFATGLRAIVRQDPDVIMVGEIRDSETAEIAIRSALTGHLVLSSLHTNDAPESMARLLDMGIQPYLIASAVRGVLAQRLVRKVCTVCRERVEPTELVMEHIRRELGEGITPTLYQGKGCSECGGTGFRSRTAISELMLVDEMIRKFILERAPGSEVRKYVSPRMRTMRQVGWEKVAQGITTPDEVIRATYLGEQSEETGLDA
ncbi:MAG: Flp pilus assembly complex ATPase component TadA [Candidatus Hydrogenedentes bacterium]|nr:Flp pilus assembly complex ATPase component TadA [Candidatus Hydrogenedentota bacterium]